MAKCAALNLRGMVERRVESREGLMRKLRLSAASHFSHRDSCYNEQGNQIFSLEEKEHIII